MPSHKPNDQTITPARKMQAGDLLTIRQAAEIAQVSKSTITRACQRGEIRYFHLGGSNVVRLYAADFHRWISRNTIDAAVIGNPEAVAALLDLRERIEHRTKGGGK